MAVKSTDSLDAGRRSERDDKVRDPEYIDKRPDSKGAVPGDVTTEPVATAEESARDGKSRVGPPTVAQDASADWHVPEGVPQIRPGEEVAANTPKIGGAIELDDVQDEFGHDVSEHRSSGDKLDARKAE